MAIVLVIVLVIFGPSLIKALFAGEADPITNTYDVYSEIVEGGGEKIRIYNARSVSDIEEQLRSVGIKHWGAIVDEDNSVVIAVPKGQGENAASVLDERQ